MDIFANCHKYWYIYEADDIDLTPDAWIVRSLTSIDWEGVPAEEYIEYQQMMMTGWDGRGRWYERVEDQGPDQPIYPEIQVVKHSETGKQHLVTLVPLPDRGEPKFIFHLGYIPFFLEPAERDERYQEVEGA